MGNQNVAIQNEVPQGIGKREWIRTAGRAVRYVGKRFIVVFLTILVGVYAAIWVTSLGGFADEQRRQEIEHDVRMGINLSMGFRLKTMSSDEREAVFQQAFDAAFKAADLDRPFLVRSFGYFRDAFTLSLGETSRIRSRTGSRDVRDILMERLPMTALLFGVANVLVFFGGLFIAMVLTQRYGSFIDRMTTLLVPLFAAPAWFHGIFLIVIFASILKFLPFGGIVDVPIPETTFGYALSVLKHMILPITALVMGMMPVAIYANRALFLIHSSEDYVDLAKAKGLGSRRLQRRYILRPVLPAIITHFALVAIVAWEGIIITEKVFNWPGLGSLLLQALEAQAYQSAEVSLIIGVVTLFAYLLGTTVLLLDILYVVVDPRVKFGAGGRS